MIPDETLDKMMHVAERCIPAPWVVDEDGETIQHEGALVADVYQARDFPCLDPDDEPEAYAKAEDEGRANAEFIANARAWVPWLVTEVRRLRAGSAGLAPAEDVRKRYFQFEAMDDAADDCGITWTIVARDLNHALEILSTRDLTDTVKLEAVEIPAERAAELTTHDDEPGSNRERLDQWPIGSALCSEY